MSKRERKHAQPDSPLECKLLECNGNSSVGSRSLHREEFNEMLASVVRGVRQDGVKALRRGVMERPNRDTLHEEYGYLVSRIARRLKRISSLHVELEELTQNGMLGLLSAWERYDPAFGVPFESFAYYRIRGAMIDELRNVTGLTRAEVRRIVRLQAASEVVNAKTSVDSAFDGSNPSSADLYAGVVRSMDIADRASIDDGEDADRKHLQSPERAARDAERKRQLHEAIAKLDEEDRLYINQHYFEDLSLAAIARERRVSRSWASRIHARAIDRLGELLEKMPNGNPSIDDE